MAHDVFVYGEFLKDRILRRVLGRLPERVPAKLRGYRRFLDDVLGHYNLVHEDEEVVEGMLLLEITDDELIELDKFDTEKYKRRAVTVETAAGPSEAWVFTGKA